MCRERCGELSFGKKINYNRVVMVMSLMSCRERLETSRRSSCFFKTKLITYVNVSRERRVANVLKYSRRWSCGLKTSITSSREHRVEIVMS